jgi:assimilatory nitrate reductase catalytic subunit
MEVRSTCPYCGVGCGVLIEHDGREVTGVRGDPEHPANFGKLCSKGSTLALTAAPVNLHRRALACEVRMHRAEPRVKKSFEDTTSHLAERFAQCIERYGPNSVGFYISGQLLTEDYYVFNKLAKGLIGTNNVDTNSRLCMSSAVAGYKQSLGADAPPCNYEDIDHADLLLIAGSNTAWAHPILFRRIEAAREKNRGMRMIVIDPRKTETAASADLHLQIEPGTDIALFNGLLHLLLWDGKLDSRFIDAHTEGFDALKAHVRSFTSASVAATCRIAEADLIKAATWFGQSRAALSLYCQGLNQSSNGTANNVALINLHLATGQIGRAGAGPFSLTGQPNAMGGREVGGLANLLSAHRDISNPAHRAEVAALWGVPDVPSVPGKTAVEMFQAAADGEIKMLWIACTNPAQSIPNQALVRAALERAELVVLQEAFVNTATAAYADVLLPASTWAEKEGTVTNSERRITRVRKAINAPGDARHDWQIVVDFARALEVKLGRAQTLFPYASAEEIWSEHRESTRGRDLDITGMSYAMLEAAPQQWPLREGESAGKARLYEDGVFPTASGKAKFIVCEHKGPAEPRDARYPFALNTGRLRDHWHGMSRSALAPRLFGHEPEPFVDLHPQDMERRGLKEGDLVHLTSRRGSQIFPVRASAAQGLSQAYVPMHWGEEFVSGAALSGQASHGVNSLTQHAYCPSSKQPELKYAAVKVLKAELGFRITAYAWLDDAAYEKALGLRDELKRFAYASLIPFGQEERGYLFRAAAYEPVGAEILTRIESLLGLDGADCMRFADRKKQVFRSVALQGDRLRAWLLAGSEKDVQAQSWLSALLQSQASIAAIRRQLMMPAARAPEGVAPRSAQVCNCFDVSQAQIEGYLKAQHGSEAEQLQSLQSSLKCGTNCGSCIPALKAAVRRNMLISAA